MSSVLSCGIEEPLQRNDCIAEFLDGDESLPGWEKPVDGLNRYSFVWLGSSSAESAAFGQILGRVASIVAQPATWIEWWNEEHEQRHKRKGAGLLDQRAEQGWRVAAHGGIFAAVSALPREDVQRLQEQSNPLAAIQHLVWFGTAPDPDVLLACSSEAMAYSARVYSITLNRELLNLVASSASTIAYLGRSTVNNGIVVVTPLKLPFREMLPERTRLGPVHDGSDADTAWLHRPSQ